MLGLLASALCSRPAVERRPEVPPKIVAAFVTGGRDFGEYVYRCAVRSPPETERSGIRDHGEFTDGIGPCKRRTACGRKRKPRS